MAYEVYSTQKVFSNELVNIYCNKLLDAVHTAFPASETKLVAEGDLSRIIQGMAKEELPVVPFVTNDANIYSYLVKNLGTILNVETQLSFKNRIQVVTSQAYFEIWFENFSATVNINELYCRDLGGSYPAPVNPYNILLADPQVFSESVENELYFQGWSSNLLSPVKVAYVVGSAAPAPVSADIQVENVFLTQPTGKYSEFKIQSRVFNWNSSNGTQNYGIVQLTGDVNVVYPGDILLENDLLKNIITSFYPLGFVEPGTFKWDLFLEVHGVRADSGLTDRGITSFSIAFEMEVLAEDEIIANKDHLHLAHIRNEVPLEGQEIEVITAGDFSLTIPDHFEVTGGNLVEQDPIFTRRIYWGTGRQMVTIKATASLDEITGSMFTGSFQLATRNDMSTGTRSSRGRKIYNVSLSAYIFEEHGFMVNPQALEFLVIKGLQPAAVQYIDVISTQDFTVQHPFWLQVKPLAGGIFEKLSVLPISADNLVAGEYIDEITLTSQAAQAEVPVTLKVVESIDEAFAEFGINFTDDNEKFTHIYSNVGGDRASCTLGVKAYNYKGFPVTSEHLFKGTFFNNRFRIHLGEIIGRRFQRVSFPSEIGFQHYNLEEDEHQLFRIFKYYKPVAANISLNIENRSSGEVSKNETFDDVQFVKGRTPKNFSNDYGILNYVAQPVRVTPKSQLLFNFLRRYSPHEIKIYRNNSIYKTVTHTPGNDSLFGLAMIFKDFTPGDVIDVRLVVDGTTLHEQKYIVFPEQKHSTHIAFFNEYNVLEIFEFTGAYEFLTETKVTSSTLYKDLVEQIENLETTKEQKLRINTGWILKSNQVIVDAIARSKQAWLIHEGREISLRPAGMKFSNQDSLRELYQYDVEFVINRKNELEVYSL